MPAVLNLSQLTHPDAEPKPNGRVLMRIRRSEIRYTWIIAQWFGRFELRADEEMSDFEVNDCDEDESETIYCKPGWYELIENWGDICAVVIHGELIGYVVLPTNIEEV